MFIDTHCHMYKEYYQDIDNYIKEAINNNVNKIVVNAVDLRTSKEVISLTKKYKEVYGAIGFHPTELGNISTADLEWLNKHLEDDKIVAVGEIGLDYHYGDTDKNKQQEVFNIQLNLAKKHNKPIIVHSRDSIQDTYNILKKYNLNGIIHCFSGSAEMARQFISLGYLIGIGGISTFKNANNIIEVIKKINLEYIVLETDAPYLTPEPYRNSINHSKYIPVIASRIASIKNINVELVEQQTTLNASHLFDF